MNIISQGEDVSDATVLRIVSNSIDKFKSMEESDAGVDKETALKKTFNTPNDANKLSKYELWKMKVNALREFSIPNPNSSHSFSGYIEFLESVKKYLTDQQ
ncbi:hypothetical protein MACJ_003618 [Theileria orientalis]|uniref:Uncharacterized protein n=1 Tax=Theileria orientalis TaxID=68886 RepID=A0A976XK84_THEOR|nr:hypothetical protein MACJ_003618 [Theileria orientalis]